MPGGRTRSNSNTCVRWPATQPDTAAWHARAPARLQNVRKLDVAAGGPPAELRADATAWPRQAALQTKRYTGTRRHEPRIRPPTRSDAVTCQMQCRARLMWLNEQVATSCPGHSHSKAAAATQAWSPALPRFVVNRHGRLRGAFPVVPCVARPADNTARTAQQKPDEAVLQRSREDKP